MRTKRYFVPVTLVGLVLVGLLSVCFAPTAAQFEYADQLCEQGLYEDAEAIYKTIMVDYPGTDAALEAGERLATLYILRGRGPEADAALEQLVADFSEHEGVARAVDHVADEYRRGRSYDKARRWYEYIVDNWPDADHAIESQRGVVLTHILRGNEADAEAAMDKLLDEFSGHERIANVVDQLGDEYRGVGKHEKALELYQYVVTNWPQAQHAIWSQRAIGICYTILGHHAAVGEVIDALLYEFSDHADLVEAIFDIAEPYFSDGFRKEAAGLMNEAKESFRRAVSIGERACREFPDYAFEADTYCWQGACYRKVDEYEKSIQCYRGLLDNYPTHELAWDALLMVGLNCEDLSKTGQLPEGEAELQTKAAYERLLEMYPDCKGARHARRWLADHNSEEKKENER